jgi:hypothetical protein
MNNSQRDNLPVIWDIDDSPRTANGRTENARKKEAKK